MKRLHFILVLLPALCASVVQAQVSVEMTSGITTEVSGSVNITLDGNWANNGTLTAGNGTVTFNGSGLQTITNAGGAFYNLTIDKPSGEVQAAGDFTVDGALTLASGNIDLNGNVITMGPSAQLTETADNTVLGAVSTTRDLNAPSSENVGGLGFEISSAANLGSTQVIRTLAAQSGNGHESILRYFDVIPTNNCNLDATVVFRYNDSELNGQSEANLQLYRSTDGGSTWFAEGGAADGGGNTVTLTGVYGFSRWTAADQSLAPPPIPPDFVFVAKDSIAVDRNEESSGHMQSNYGSIQFYQGAPGQHTGNLLAGQDIVIDVQNTIIGDARAGGEILLAGGASITGSQSEHTPVDVILQPEPSFAACGPSATVNRNGSLTLPPGTYGDVKVDARGQLHLSAGDYYMNTLALDNSAALYLDVSGGEVNVNVVSMLQFARQATVEVTGGGTEQARFTTLQSDTVHIEQSSVIRGTLIASNAEVFLERASAFTGALYADKIRVAPDVQFQPHGSGAPLSKSGEVNENGGEEITAEDVVVTNYALEQNYPNPFNPTTAIRFDLPDAGEVNLSIYNTSGQLVKKLVAGEMNAGRHNVVWDATNARGERVASGVYLYVIKAGTFTARRKLVLMK